MPNSIKELREKRGWSQAELARRVQTTQNLISKYERGEADMYTGTMLRIADALGVTPNRLLADPNKGGKDA